ncbi:MAG: Gfo/Idh/MocA family oxidoreductase [Planctomycetaceae bacterium]
MSHRPTRRDFIKQTTALGAAWWVGNNSSAYAFADSKSPLERVNFACIGVKGKGDSDSSDAASHGNIVALCDIDDVRLAAKAEDKRFQKAQKFNDYREMLSKIGDKIDAVTVSIPDHSHASASIRAMRMGKHVFCQKPLTWSVSEARMMRETAAKMGVATQMGNQGTAELGLREAVEVVRGGTLGKVQEVHVWTNRPVWPQGTGRPKESQPIPPNVHWDLFLGPAPERPYYSIIYHPFKWRGWLDFGTGALGDMACHTANMAVMALDLFDPLTVVADSSGIVENETYPKWSVIEFEFGPRGDMPPCKLTWYDGGKLPPAELLHGEESKSSGSLLVGEKGTLYSPNDYGAAYVLLPKENFKDFKKPEPSLPRSPGHFEEFVIACRGGSPAMSNFNYAARLTETILLGNVAMRAGQKFEWDAANLQVINLPDANKFLKREYRKGWEL